MGAVTSQEMWRLIRQTVAYNDAPECAYGLAMVSDEWDREQLFSMACANEHVQSLHALAFLGGDCGECGRQKAGHVAGGA